MTMDIMYISIDNEGQITDVTNDKYTDNTIHLNLRYILGKDYVIFTKEGNQLFVQRFKKDTEIYKAELEYNNDYMVAPLFVDKYKSIHPIIRDIYTFLKRNFNGKFYLEENKELDESYEMIFSSWVDVKFDYKFRLSVNTNLMTNADAQMIREHLMFLKDVNLYKLHTNLEGRSIFIDENAINLMKGINSLVDERAVSQ